MRARAGHVLLPNGPRARVYNHGHKLSAAMSDSRVDVYKCTPITAQFLVNDLGRTLEGLKQVKTGSARVLLQSWLKHVVQAEKQAHVMYLRARRFRRLQHVDKSMRVRVRRDCVIIHCQFCWQFYR